MAIGTSGGVGRLGALFACGVLGGKSDAELLRLFADGEAAEAAFEAMVRRHGPDVLRACRRVLADPNDAEDAFQATFLVLARRAASGSIGRSEPLGPWLRGVALRVARKARVAAARRRKHEARAAGPLEAGRSQPPDDLATAIRDEVERLPEPLRSPVVLCYLEDMTYRGAAARLRVSEATIRGRLVKARSLLRSRLGRHEDPCPSPRPPRVPPALLAMTVRAASALAPGGAGVASVPIHLVKLMEGVLTMTLATHAILGAVAAGAVGLAVAGGASMAAGGDDRPPGSPAIETGSASRPAMARADEARPAPVLTLDEAIVLLRKNATRMKAAQLEIPMARADVLDAAAGLGVAPRDSALRESGPALDAPLDVGFKRLARHSGAKTVAEAQYQDAVRMRVDALYSAYVDVQEMNTRIEMQKQWRTIGGRFVLLAQDLHAKGLRRELDRDVLVQVMFHQGLPVVENPGDRTRKARRTLGIVLNLDSVAGADRFHVEPMVPVTSLPPAAELVRLALEARPDLVAMRLGLRRAEEVLRKAEDGVRSEEGEPGEAGTRHPAERGNVLRARINLDETRRQLASLEESVRREVEDRHERCAGSLRELEESPVSPRRTQLICQELEAKYAAGREDAVGVRRACVMQQEVEARYLKRLVEHRRSVLALNTAVGVRLFP